MAPTILARALALLAFLPLFASAIDRCPGTENTYITGEGFIYKICPDTDFVGTTTELISGVADALECMLRCDERDTCQKAVFEPAAKFCHIKTSAPLAPLSWVVNAKYDTIRLANEIAEDAKVNICPFNEQREETASGRAYALCPGTDFNVPDTRYQVGVASAGACAGICAATVGCNRAVWEGSAKICHLKPALAVTTRVEFTLAKKFDAIRLL